MSHASAAAAAFDATVVTTTDPASAIADLKARMQAVRDLCATGAPITAGQVLAVLDPKE